CAHSDGVVCSRGRRDQVRLGACRGVSIGFRPTGIGFDAAAAGMADCEALYRGCATLLAADCISLFLMGHCSDPRYRPGYVWGRTALAADRISVLFLVCPNRDGAFSRS